MDNHIKIFDNLFQSNISKFQNLSSKSYIIRNDTEKNSYLPMVQEIRELFGKEGEIFSKSIGTHPDFFEIENTNEYQYICSLFVDISGSTKLALKYSLDKVKLYKNAIISSAIEIFRAFDGHIHRIQGDAVLVYFGHKELEKSDAIINAINAASLMQYFNATTLKKFFESENLEPLKIRIGIDFGDDSSVLWSKYGIDGINEITSTSIHTDLASKLQNKAPSNKIMIGENINKYLDIPTKFRSIKTEKNNGVDVEKRYILNTNNLGRYSMEVFEWEKYLNSFSMLPPFSTENEQFYSPRDLKIRCWIIDEKNQDKYEYIERGSPLKKEMNLLFKLEIYNQCLEFKNIKWRVVNYGEEAKKDKELEFEMNQYEGYQYCNQKTAYTGLHFMECYLYDINDKIICHDSFGLFINDNNREVRKLGIED
ncbi:TPA: Pycsar phage resistance system cytidylate cyclase PycC [Staphylococcus aureus]|uniref:Pycsar phage resistance system cytidylate cyclase PycC n=1 Tax=Staphylococcus aureus TaxID=1280 RepID=UPI000806B32B|nr:Pycsar phage resistance system cytidylate cyclase PycC [Staphylococcus aureus]AWQ30247.1 adenylate/guanylate cyclase domain-containing protein [Staphylococcus aureus]MBF2706930.1 adenylate/guanylate cyclase domain-containing protein [Staphylococcus aureus]MBF2712532.1 adenylate/guanylate cyclase domain-containing protein [Staphylococcus aureus]MBF2723482.1 adenylate/guanylate cyclase domain-containing protein [Staphylococcus aureus]MBU6094060.1 adenylate/guanylate cyclase domain-containing 